MSEKDTIYSGKIKDKSAIFDFGELYGFIYTWFIDEDYKFQEDQYSEKVTPKGKEVEIDWTAKKKISDYFRFAFKIKWRILGLKDVEVEKDGAKVKMNKGSLEIKITAVLEKDYENNWEKSPFLKFLRNIYNKYVIRGRIDLYEEKIYSQADDILAEIKAFLSLEGER
jgi:hypothetical protein